MNRRCLIWGILLCLLFVLACGISMDNAHNEPDQAQLLQTVEALNSSNSQQKINQSSDCDLILNIKDITLPDGVELEPNSNQTKTWEMTNGGTCTWSNNYKIALLSPDYLIVEMYPLNQIVVPGQSAQISVPIRVPAESGSYLYNFMLVNENGYTFGFGENARKPFWAAFSVSISPQIAAVELQEPTVEIPSSAANDNPSANNTCSFSANLVRSPGKTIDMKLNERSDIYWTLTNTGTCIWDPSYQMVLLEGDMLKTVDKLVINQVVQPGQSVELWLPVVSADKTGYYYQKWKLRDSAGNLIGFGNNPSFPELISIRVSAETAAQPPPNEPAPLPPEPQKNFTVTNVEWVTIPNYEGVCPVSLDTSVRITTNGPGEVKYRMFWEDKFYRDGTITYSSAGTKTLKVPRTFSSDWFKWYVSFEITSPINKNYGYKNFEVYCYDPHWKTVRITGTAEVKDDEIWQDERKTFNISDQFIFDADHTSHTFNFIECVGGEVRVEIRGNLVSNADGSVSFNGGTNLFEGISCSNAELEDRAFFNLNILPMQTLYIYNEVNNTEKGGGDYAKVNLQVTNFHELPK